MNPLSPRTSLTYAIIGGCGFLGQHLVHDLLENNNIHIKIVDKCAQPKALTYPNDFSSPAVQLCLNVDITQLADCENVLQGVDVVFVLAAAIAYGRKNKAL
ncbi:MAG TPA: NAD-dependent epimerase/dehydratase family protein, partial [Gammaproteobacteria bacterium]|nr:NAD-dependent epimerase/dehydratase family protein [Gammaproteobacteria bacterium]